MMAKAWLLAVLSWLLPTLLFANLASLLYFAIHPESTVARFLNEAPGGFNSR